LKALKYIFISLAVLAVIGAAGYFGFHQSEPGQETAIPAPQTIPVSTCDVNQTIYAPGRLVNFDAVIVNMPVDGKLTDVLVKPGDQVSAGQPLANLDDMAKNEANLQLLEAKEALETAEKYRQALDYPRATDDYIHTLEEEIEVKRQNIVLLEDLYHDAGSTKEKSDALNNLSNAKVNLDEMTTRLNWYKGKPTQDDFDQADSQLSLAQAQYEAAQKAIIEYEIKSPINGIIVEIDAVTGEEFKTDQNLFKIINPLSLEVQANITEEDYPLIQTGMKAEIFVDAKPDLILQGQVERIVPMRISDNNALYNIYIALENVPEGLADGMNIDASIIIDKREDVLCLPRSLIRTSGGNTANIQIWNGSELESREVEIGLRGDNNVEILNGLNENDQAVIR
jgi:HlyD family secretion protein